MARLCSALSGRRGRRLAAAGAALVAVALLSSAGLVYDARSAGPEPQTIGTLFSGMVPSLTPLANADAVCDKFADPAGSDAEGDGTQARPYATPEKLVASLADGQTGCLKPGDYGSGETWKITNGGTADDARITLMSDPGSSARARLFKRLVIPDGTDFVSLKNLSIDGSENASYAYGTYASPAVYGDDVEVIGNDITNPTGTCVFLGGPGFGTADRTLVQDNVIHHCGLPGDKHMHALYVNLAHDTQVVGNTIYAVATRGILLYRDADRAVVRGNVVDRAGAAGIQFSGDDGYTTDNAEVWGNVVTNSGADGNLNEWWPQGPGTGNTAYYNCLWPSGTIRHTDPSGYADYSNIFADPLYADAAARDYAVNNPICNALLEAGRR